MTNLRFNQFFHIWFKESEPNTRSLYLRFVQQATDFGPNIPPFEVIRFL